MLARKNEAFFLMVRVLLLGCCLFLGFSACRQPEVGAPDKVILIVADTLRPDHLSCYGYQARTTPHIDSLARSGAIFTQAVNAIPETGPALSSILTAFYPYRHGVRANVFPMPQKTRSMVQVLRDQGFKTAAFTDTFPFRRLKILKGFNFFHRRVPVKTSEEDYVASAVGPPVSWLRQNKNEKFFVLIHYYDAHLPYNPMRPSEKTQALDYSGPYNGDMGPAMTLWDDRLEVNSEDVRYMQSLYDDEIQYVDRYVGTILEELENLGIKNETLLVFTADHGEAFGEHAYYFDHGDLLYEDQIRIPLIFHYPPVIPEGSRFDHQVRSVDVLPTIFQLLGQPSRGRKDGVSLAPLFKGKKDLLGTRFSVSESDAINFLNPNCRGFIDGVKGKHFSIRRDGKKLIYVPGHPDGEFEFYDLESDPDETHNLMSEKPAAARELVEYLRKWLSQQSVLKSDREKLDQQAEEILKSLGYIHK